MSARKPPPPPAVPRPSTEWDTSTLRLSKGEVSLYHQLGGMAQAHACLVQYSGPDAGRRIELDRGRMVLGRSAECEICIDSPDISRVHAVLQQDGDRWLLHDQGSANGTRVNNQRVGAAVALQDGDLVRLGNMALKFYERQSVDALLHDRIYRMATVDDGTDVFSKRYLMEALEREVRRAQRSGRALSLLCIDLDHFKVVNDRYGHIAGDQVLRGAAGALQAQVRGSDVLGRIGGEEFAAVLPETPLTAALELAERMRAALAAQDFVLELRAEPGPGAVKHRQTASFGAACLSPGMPDGRALLGAADAQLYAAKRSGRNCVSG